MSRPAGRDTMSRQRGKPRRVQPPQDDQTGGPRLPPAVGDFGICRPGLRASAFGGGRFARRHVASVVWAVGICRRLFGARTFVRGGLGLGHLSGAISGSDICPGPRRVRTNVPTARHPFRSAERGHLAGWPQQLVAMAITPAWRPGRFGGGARGFEIWCWRFWGLDIWPGRLVVGRRKLTSHQSIKEHKQQPCKVLRLALLGLARQAALSP
jgi:hypothetical protein